MPQGVDEASAFAEDGEPAEHEAEDVQEDEAEGESGCGYADDRPTDDCAVDPRAPAPCRCDPEGDADGDGEDECADGEPRGERDAGGEHVGDGRCGAHRVAEVTGDGAGQPVPVAHDEGLVQAVTRGHGLANLRG